MKLYKYTAILTLGPRTRKISGNINALDDEPVEHVANNVVIHIKKDWPEAEITVSDLTEVVQDV